MSLDKLRSRVEALEKAMPTSGRTIGFFAGWNDEMADKARAAAKLVAEPGDRVVLVSWLPPTDR